MKPLLRILALWRGRSGWLWLGLLVSLAALSAGVGLMVAAGQRVALATGMGVLAGGLVLRALGVLRVALRYLERLLTHGATFRALADLRVWFFRGLARRAAGGLGWRHAGDVLSRLVGDVEALDGLYLRILVPLAGAVLLLPVLLVVVGRRSPGLAALVGVLFVLAAFVLPALAARLTAASGTRLTQAMAALRIACLDAIAGLREVRAYGAEGRMLAAMQAREAALLGAQRSLAQRAALAHAGAFLCGQAALLAALGYLVTHKAAATAGGHAGMAAIIVLFLLVAAFEAVGGLPQAGALAGHAAAAAARVLRSAEPVADAAATRIAVATTLPEATQLRFDAVQFRWQPDRALVFDGLQMEIPAGARVALLGASGAGKSTLAALALKISAPQAGCVRLGGVDIAALPDHFVRQRIAYLSQATHLFDDTIRANLLLGRPEADDTALWAALDQAAVGDFVRSLPDGLDAWLGEGGARVSGGQGRRLALARTLLSRAPILILDEPAAGLDAETEREFLTTLNQVASGRSVILIAHRLTGVERLDRIWRLSAGHAVAATA